ncbi:hypothetical protein ACQEVF_56440 [Nonomuraea polychroma]|uniref:hypothetical protein n=1 Tax=Nonomuraea polychroma TaxID=46176 RepID=UPI003D944EDF
MAEGSDLGSDTLDELAAAIHRYGRDYARYSASHLWPRAAAARRHVATLLERRPTLRQRQDLSVAAAWLSVILAWLAHDQGEHAIALGYAADSRRRANEAGHQDVLAWAFDVESTIWFYTNLPQRAAHAADAGLRHAAPSSSARHRLLLQRARAHARRGRPDQSMGALTATMSMQDSLPAVARGLFAADAARVHSCAATAHLALNNPHAAREHASQAVELYSAADGVAPTRQAIALLDWAISCAQLRHIDEAVAYGLRAVHTGRSAAAILARGRELDAVLASHATNEGDRFRDELARLAAPR